SLLSTITPSIAPEYGVTSFNESRTVLFADLTLRNIGTLSTRGPLVVAIARLSDPGVRVTRSDGFTPQGLPYFIFNQSNPNETFSPGQLSKSRSLAFINHDHVPFSFELMVLGQFNRPPVFTSQPVTEAIRSRAYAYQATATDPD